MKPSEEKIWEKFYFEDAKKITFPELKVYDLVYEQNKNRKDCIALEYEGTNVSYGQFFDKVEEKIDFFKSKNVKENDIITFSMLMTPEFVYDWYALGQLNAISNLIDPRTSIEGISEYIKEAKSSILLNHDLFTSKIKKAVANQDIHVINYSLGNSAYKMPFTLGIASKVMGAYSNKQYKHNSQFEKYKAPDEIKESEVANYVKNQALSIVHTGGTTGFPKGVLLSHDNYNAMAYEYMKSHIGFSADDRFLLIMPPWISYGSGMLHMSLVTGMKATIISKLDSKKMTDYIVKYKPQWFAGVPAHYNIICNSKLPLSTDLSFLKAGAVGGDSMSGELYEKSQKFIKERGARQGVYPGYALTEVTSAFAVKHTDYYKPNSVGIPLPGGTMGIFEFDEDRQITLEQELDYNKVGEICLRTPNQMLGYFNNEELTNLVLRKHNDGNTWVHTGDLGYIDEEGFLYVTGRIKEMIVRHDGFKIYPSLIEKVINSNANIASSKVVGVFDYINKNGQIPVAFMVIKNESKQYAKQIIKDIKEKCKECLPGYYTEYLNFDVIEKLPLTAVGKVDYKTLQEKKNKTKKLLRK